MGFLDKIKKALSGGGNEKADDAKAAAAKSKAKADEAAAKTKTKVEETTNNTKRAADKADKAVDDTTDDVR